MMNDDWYFYDQDDYKGTGLTKEEWEENKEDIDFEEENR